MRVGAMLRDILESLFRRPVTRQYPFERKATSTRLRGKLEWDPSKCTGCGLCSKDCPSDALELVVNDKKTKTFVMRYNVDRCTFCAQCVQNCRFNCLGMSSTDWELAALTKEPFTIYYGENEHVQAFLECLEAKPELVAPAAPETSS